MLFSVGSTKNKIDSVKRDIKRKLINSFVFKKFKQKQKN